MSGSASNAVGNPAVGNFDQPILPIADPQNYNAVHAAIEGSFSAPKVNDFLKSLTRTDLRIRDFEGVLRSGLLGDKTKAEYDRLGNADQGQIRELYLASLEKISPELRQKYFKLYAYY
jgi:hypothetical protein